jgi:hypothetical protein
LILQIIIMQYLIKIILTFIKIRLMFKKSLLSICILLVWICSKAQEIVNIVLVGENGVTANIKNL